MYIEKFTKFAKYVFSVIIKSGDEMEKDKLKDVSYIDGVFYKLSETARVAELLGRSYYKQCAKTENDMMDIDEFIILSHIIANPDLSQSDIAKLVYKGKAHIGKILTVMEKKGYITRNLNMVGNIMVKNTVVTRTGLKLYNLTAEKARNSGSKVLESFSDDEIKTLEFLLDKFKNSILRNNKLVF